jgi:GTP cyclohydrolase I
MKPKFTQRHKEISLRFKEIMQLMGLDPDSDPSLIDTPNRWSRMMLDELAVSVNKPEIIVKTFPNDSGYNQMIVEKDIRVSSMCEHHFVPFVGVAHIAYIPGDKIIGLSKFHRIVNHYSAMPQIQERLTEQVADKLKRVLGIEDVAVVIKAKHLCCNIRGVRDPNSSTVTSSVGGRFLIQEVKDEFFKIVAGV